MIECTENNTKLQLNEPALKKGGEGAIYTIEGHENVVAKIYTSRQDAMAREEKIREMVKLSKNPGFIQSGILDKVAWPLASLYDESGKFNGFGMKKVKSSLELQNLYSYSLNENKKTISTLEKVATLIDLCSAVEKLHGQHQVIGDFGPNNIKIAGHCQIKIVDADSCHFHTDQKVYPCVVCSAGYIAPELLKRCKGTTYKELFETTDQTFTVETDRFALAIHCFRMLMNGCHPYLCKPKSVEDSTPMPTLDNRVEAGEIPFFVEVENCTIPSWTPDLKSFPMPIQKLFKRAFVEGHRDPSARPTATEWKKALTDYKAKMCECKKNPKHWYWKHAKCCPYCKAEKNGKSNMISAMSAARKLQPAKKRLVKKKINNIENSFGKLSTHAKLYWIFSVFFAAILHNLLGVKLYAPLYYAFCGNEYPAIELIGPVGSIISAVAGVILFNAKWASVVRRKNNQYRWYDFMLAQLTGIGFAIGFGILLAMAVIAVVVGLYVLAIIFMLIILKIIFSALS